MRIQISNGVLKVDSDALKVDSDADWRAGVDWSEQGYRCSFLISGGEAGTVCLEEDDVCLLIS
jgi:hypothetical protein